MLIISL
jgi:hypothetical protein